MWGSYGKKITSEQFDKRLEEYFPSLIRITEYINSKSTIVFKCKKCGKEFRKKPKEINNIKCGCEYKHDKYKDDIAKKGIIPLENYVNIRHKIKHKCLKCENSFTTSPKSMLNSVIGCPSCSGKIFSINRYKSLLPKNLELLSTEYIGCQYKHLHKCLDCGSEFNTKPNLILHMNTNCPICAKSKGERIIADFLNELGLFFEREYTILINDRKLRFDFYIKDIDLFIEYDGIQHFIPVDLFGGEEAFSKTIENDRLKDEWCRFNEKQLLRISYKEDIYLILKSIFLD